jgi:hypothetical protein
MNSINLNMTSVEVKAETRALKCEWTREMAKDIDTYHNFDMSSFEIYIAKEMRKEMRKKSINKIFQN